MKRTKCGNVGERRTGAPMLVVLSVLGFVVGLANGAIAQQRRAPDTNIPAIKNPLLSQSAGEEKILEVLDDLNKNQRQGMNVPLEDGRLLRLLTESVGAKRVVEIGTSTDIQASGSAWLCEKQAAA
ncbi:MAG: hypothetical protein QGG36_17625 [Pirellulaceae bacterium]|nr:hypothetical protein [Pirellulaceae bacterium]